MKRCRWIALWMLAAVAARAGTIRGTVRAQPPPGAEAQLGEDGAYASRKWKFVERIDYEHLKDFVVYIDQPLAKLPPSGRVPAAVTTQKDANFDPHVLPIAVGTTVRWPNEDDIYHNVFSTSEVKSFDLGLYHKERTPEITFDRIGRVDVFCAIHTNMHCIILVLPNSYFAMADSRGRFVIKDVPAGTYPVKAWHERMPAQVKEIIVPEEGEVRVDFALGLGELPTH